MVICSHGFVKKRQKAPLGEIEIGKEWRRRYCEAKRQATLDLEE